MRNEGICGLSEFNITVYMHSVFTQDHYTSMGQMHRMLPHRFTLCKTSVNPQSFLPHGQILVNFKNIGHARAFCFLTAESKCCLRKPKLTKRSLSSPLFHPLEFTPILENYHFCCSRQPYGNSYFRIQHHHPTVHIL